MNWLYMLLTCIFIVALQLINCIGQAKNIMPLNMLFGGLLGFFVYGGVKFWFINKS